MTKGNLSREQAVAIVGEATVAACEAENCDFTNRLMGDPSVVEFRASKPGVNQAGDDVMLSIYYYQDAADLEGVDDLGSLDWTIEGYEVA